MAVAFPGVQRFRHGAGHGHLLGSWVEARKLARQHPLCRQHSFDLARRHSLRLAWLADRTRPLQPFGQGPMAGRIDRTAWRRARPGEAGKKPCYPGRTPDSVGGQTENDLGAQLLGPIHQCQVDPPDPVRRRPGGSPISQQPPGQLGDRFARRARQQQSCQLLHIPREAGNRRGLPSQRGPKLGKGVADQRRATHKPHDLRMWLGARYPPSRTDGNREPV